VLAFRLSLNQSCSPAALIVPVAVPKFVMRLLPESVDWN
jgi:hypothetical protein